jgi:hypothetical protein
MTVEPARQPLADGHQRTFAANVLAPHLLTHLLSAELQARLLWLGSGPVRTLSAWPRHRASTGRSQAGHPLSRHLVARGTFHTSGMGEPPIGCNVVLCGVKIFRIADGTIVERWRPERSPRSRARSQTCGSRTRRR